MLLPLVVLAVLSIVGGVLNLPFTHDTETLEHVARAGRRVRRATSTSTGRRQLPAGADRHRRSRSLGIVAAVAGLPEAQGSRPIEPEVLADGWYYDEAVTAFMGGPGRDGVRGDRLVRRATSSTARSTASAVWCAATAQRHPQVQTGYVRNYAAAIGVGAVLLLGWFVVVRGMPS